VQSIASSKLATAKIGKMSSRLKVFIPPFTQ
jgi:hypothetical protein